MSRKHLKPGEGFQKGNKIGKYKRLPVDIYESRMLNKIEFERICNKYLYMKKEDLQKAAKDPSIVALEMMIIGLIHKAAVYGDDKRLNFLLDRLIGKVRTPVELSGSVNMHEGLVDLIKKHE